MITQFLGSFAYQLVSLRRPAYLVHILFSARLGHTIEIRKEQIPLQKNSKDPHLAGKR